MPALYATSTRRAIGIAVDLDPPVLHCVVADTKKAILCKVLAEFVEVGRTGKNGRAQAALLGDVARQRRAHRLADLFRIRGVRTLHEAGAFSEDFAHLLADEGRIAAFQSLAGVGNSRLRLLVYAELLANLFAWRTIRYSASRQRRDEGLLDIHRALRADLHVVEVAQRDVVVYLLQACDLAIAVGLEVDLSGIEFAVCQRPKVVKSYCHGLVTFFSCMRDVFTLFTRNPAKSYSYYSSLMQKFMF